MTDFEALKVLSTKPVADMDTYFEALAVAGKKLQECQWRGYEHREFGWGYDFTFGSKVILGIRYDDGSKGSVNGHVLYSMDNGHYLVIDKNEQNYYTDNAVIEKFMKFPDYN